MDLAGAAENENPFLVGERYRCETFAAVLSYHLVVMALSLSNSVNTPHHTSNPAAASYGTVQTSAMQSMGTLAGEPMSPMANTSLSSYTGTPGNSVGGATPSSLDRKRKRLKFRGRWSLEEVSAFRIRSRCIVACRDRLVLVGRTGRAAQDRSRTI